MVQDHNEIHDLEFWRKLADLRKRLEEFKEGGVYDTYANMTMDEFNDFINARFFPDPPQETTKTMKAYQPLILLPWTEMRMEMNGHKLRFSPEDLGVGFMPVYATKEEAEELWPGHPVLEINIPVKDEQVRSVQQEPDNGDEVDP